MREFLLAGMLDHLVHGRDRLGDDLRDQFLAEAAHEQALEYEVEGHLGGGSGCLTALGASYT